MGLEGLAMTIGIIIGVIFLLIIICACCCGMCCAKSTTTHHQGSVQMGSGRSRFKNRTVVEDYNGAQHHVYPANPHLHHGTSPAGTSPHPGATYPVQPVTGDYLQPAQPPYNYQPHSPWVQQPAFNPAFNEPSLPGQPIGMSEYPSTTHQEHTKKHRRHGSDGSGGSG